MNYPLKNDKDRLDQELDAILAPLGVEQKETAEQQHAMHIMCLYSNTDATLWYELERYLALLKHRYHSMLYWHSHRITNHPSLCADPWVAERIKRDIARADIVLLGLSVDLALCLLDHGRLTYQQLIERTEDPADGPEILPILFRETPWQDEQLPLRPTNPARPIARSRNRDQAYMQVSSALEAAIERCKERRATN